MATKQKPVEQVATEKPEDQTYAVVPTVEALKQSAKEHLKGLTTTSSKIRALNAAGFTRSQIAKIVDKRYQHVRNVLVTPVQTPRS